MLRNLILTKNSRYVPISDGFDSVLCSSLKNNITFSLKEAFTNVTREIVCFFPTLLKLPAYIVCFKVELKKTCHSVVFGSHYIEMSVPPFGGCFYLSSDATPCGVVKTNRRANPFNPENTDALKSPFSHLHKLSLTEYQNDILSLLLLYCICY